MFGKKEPEYVPWSADYFARVRAEQATFLARTRSLGRLEEYVVLNERRTPRRILLTVKRGDEWPYIMKLAAQDRPPGHNLGIMREAVLLIGLSSSYHLVPFDTFSEIGPHGGYAATYSMHRGNLAERVAAGPVSGAEIAHYGLQLAAELTDLHDAGVFHLAIEPENCVFEHTPSPNFLATWRLLLTNFDLRAEDSETRELLPATTLTPFTAPELHHESELGPHIDVWGLGAVLFFLATKRAPGEVASVFEGVGVPRVDTLAPSCPAWLADVIARCLELDPAQRLRTPRAVFDQLLQHVHVTTDYDGAQGARGAAGPDPKEAKAVVRDRFLLASATRMGRVRNSNKPLMKDLGWATRTKEVDRLRRLETVSAAYKAANILLKLLGDWDDPRAPVAQLAADPRREQYQPLPPVERWVGDERWSSNDPPIPRGVLWALLDSACRRLTEVVEATARPEAVEQLRLLCTRWAKAGTFGTPDPERASMSDFPAHDSIVHVAQGLVLVGEFELARRLMDAALADYPSSPLVVMTAFTVARERADYERAETLVQRLAALTMKKDLGQFSVAFFLAADLAFQAGDLETAKERYRVLLQHDDSESLKLLAKQVEVRLAKRASPEDVEETKCFIPRGQRLDLWLAALEVAYWAGDRRRAEELLHFISEAPQFKLPNLWWYTKAVAQIEEEFRKRSGAPQQ